MGRKKGTSNSERGSDPRLEPRIRVYVGDKIALGPGKVELLTAIDEHGSMAAAGRALGMSYMRAWTLVKTMNACFKEPLVVSDRGGAKKGSARLTPMGTKVLDLHRRITSGAIKATNAHWRSLKSCLAGDS